MGILLDDTSAFEYWRHEGKEPTEASPPAPAFGSPQSKSLLQPSSIEIAELEQRGFSYLTKPIRIMVPHRDMRRRSDKAVFRVCSKSLPASACKQIQHDIFVVRPELALMHMAQRLSLAKIVQLGFEACGTYRLCPDGGFMQAEPLTSPASLQGFLRNNSGLCGSKALARALPFVLAGAASPMESIVAMLLELAPKYGGYGLPAPKLNYKLSTGARGQTVTSKKYFVMDLCWPEKKLAAEYDSDEFHVGSERIAADAERRNALLHLGYEVVTVSRLQVMSATEFDDVAHILAKRLGRQLRPRAKAWGLLQQQLREEILPSQRAP